MEREFMEYDLVIVGAGPAGLGAAIRAKQVAEEKGQEVSVCVLEKGSEVGAHILSGAVLEPRALDELIPDWKEKGAPVTVPVKEERFLLLSETAGRSIPLWMLPPQTQNHGNYIISLGNLCRWLGEQAEAMGVEIYPGFAAAEILFDESGRVTGVATGDMGIGKDGEQKAEYTQGMELRATYTLFAEGCRGSLSKQLEAKFNLRDGVDPQTYGIGIKELWELDPAKHQEGLVMHTAGWPMDNNTWGGSFIYHLENNQAYVGYVIGLDYQNPHLSTFDEFQRFKMHPKIREILEGGKRLAYGARALNEGGLQSVPKLAFPGGALIGCAAGFLNVPKIKGSHTAMKTGMLAAEAVVAALAEGDNRPAELSAYPAAYRSSWVYEELYRARNLRPAAARFGMKLGMAIGGFDMKVLGGKAPWTFHHRHADHECLKPADQMPKIAYPKPDGVVSFDKLSSVFLSNTNHEEDQPVHLTLKDPSVPIEVNLKRYDEPAQRYCPAGVYEIVEEDSGPRLQINAQNCVHCKTCDIKDPTQNIVWVTPEGGGGPNYPNM
ncbi:MAG: electron transfer flavoprotein-ubiquinone oxidoreductase [Kiloniellales bacterium]